MSKTNTEMLTDEIMRLFTAFPRGTNAERAGLYVGVLTSRAVAWERCHKAVTHFIETWERESPPPVAKVLGACFGRMTETRSEREMQDAKVLRYYLERYEDVDYYEFLRAFGYAPRREQFERLEIPVPPGCTFRAPDRAACESERAKAHEAMRCAFKGLKAIEENSDEITRVVHAEHPMTEDQREAQRVLGWE